MKIVRTMPTVAKTTSGALSMLMPRRGPQHARQFGQPRAQWRNAGAVTDQAGHVIAHARIDRHQREHHAAEDRRR